MKLFGGKHEACAEKKKIDFSKKLINDNRFLLWIINIGGLALAFYCVHQEYIGGLPWIAGMVTAAWAAHGTVCSWYFSMAKQDHSSADGTGITFAAAAANGFADTKESSWESPKI